MVRTLTLVLLAASLSLSAQTTSPDDFRLEEDGKVFFYFNRNEKLIDNKHNATLYREATQRDDGFWDVTDFYVENKQVRRTCIKKNPNPLFSKDYKGEYITYFKSGNISESITYDEKSKKVGNYLSNYEDGQIEETGNYVDGKKEGEWKSYHKNGNIHEIKSYSMGELSDSLVVYHKNGQVKRRAFYKKAGDKTKLHGDEYNYYENGQLKSVVSYVKGDKRGEFTEYHDNGEVKTQGEFSRKGNKTGTFKEFYDNGRLKVEKRYDKDVVARQSDVYHKNGEIKEKIETLIDGKYNGPYKRFFDTGELAEEGEFEEGKRIGVFKTYRKGSGTLHTEFNHESGEKTFYDESGNVVVAPHLIDAPPIKDKKLIKEINKNLDISEKHQTKNRGVYGFTVSAKGEVVDVKVLTSADDVVDAAAMEALKKIKTEVPLKNGEPVKENNALVIYFERGAKKYDMMPGAYYYEVDNQKDYEMNNNKDDTYFVVEEMPEFKGGQSNLFKFLSDNIVYPGFAKDQGLQGVVFITFTVDRSGVLTDLRIIRGVHPLLDLAAMDVVGHMPAWNPGLQKGKPVLVQFNLPIRFTLR